MSTAERPGLITRMRRAWAEREQRAKWRDIENVLDYAQTEAARHGEYELARDLSRVRNRWVTNRCSGKEGPLCE